MRLAREHARVDESGGGPEPARAALGEVLAVARTVDVDANGVHGEAVVLTTSTFTADARREAVRDGAPPIELVDGDKLVRMLEDLELGLVPVQSYRVEPVFFDEFAE